MIVHVYNDKTDDCLYIFCGLAGSVARVRLGTVAIDPFIEALQKHASSEGDGSRFTINGRTGKVEVFGSEATLEVGGGAGWITLWGRE